jgi:hypothetical protein
VRKDDKALSSSPSSSRPKNYFHQSIKEPITNDFTLTKQIGEFVDPPSSIL